MTSTRTIGLRVAGCVLALLAAVAILHAGQITGQPPVPESQPPAAAPAPVVTNDDIAATMSLLDRMDRIVIGVRKNPDADVRNLMPVGTSGGSGATAMIKIDAASLDEIHAEIEQIRRLLRH